MKPSTVLPLVHAALFGLAVLFSPRVTAADLEPCALSAAETAADGAGLLCSSDLHQLVIAGRDLGSWWPVRSFLLLDLPSVLALVPFSTFFSTEPSGHSRIIGSYVVGGALLAAATLQWWVFGKACSWLAKRQRQA